MNEWPRVYYRTLRDPVLIPGLRSLSRWREAGRRECLGRTRSVNPQRSVSGHLPPVQVASEVRCLSDEFIPIAQTDFLFLVEVVISLMMSREVAGARNGKRPKLRGVAGGGGAIRDTP